MHFLLLLTVQDVAIRKPLAVTCGEDKSVRVWNILTKTTELIKWNTEKPYSVAFHPSGLHVLVGFADKLRLMNVLMDDIRTFKEFPIKVCSCPRSFSAFLSEIQTTTNSNSLQHDNRLALRCSSVTGAGRSRL